MASGRNLKRSTSSPPCVLIAEDSEIHQKLAINLFEGCGFRVLIASTGIEALDLFRRHKVDLVVLDCQMPELDGYGTAERIREEERLRGVTPVPIIALTALSDVLNRDRCIKVGMDDWFTKPLNTRQVSNLQGRWFSSAARP